MSIPEIKVETIELTPSWQDILPTWLMMFEQAILGNCTNPDLIRANAKQELRRMAQAADKWNAHCRDNIEADAAEMQRVNEELRP